MMQQKGLFISFEGIDGSGKTTIINQLKQQIDTLIKQKKLNYTNLLITREPGGYNDKLCEDLRNIIINNNVSPKTEVLLLAANRIEHINRVIIPALNRNEIVITDRFVDSSLAYQGEAKLSDLFTVLKINEWGFDLMPTITFYLDIDPQLASNRMNTDTNRMMNRFDKQSIEFHHKVRESYLNLSKQYSNRYCVINANDSVEKIVSTIIKKICQIAK